MRKKFLSAFMVGALALAATSTITSCKDYDGDISSLKEQIKSLESAVAQKEATINSSIQSLQAAIAQANNDHATKAALAAAVAELESAINAKYNTLVEKDAQLSAAIQAAQAAADAAAKVAKENTDAIQKVANDLATANEKLNTLSTDLQKANADIATLKAALVAQKAELEAALAAQKAELEAADAENLQKALDAVNALKAEVEAADKALEAKIAEEAAKVAEEIEGIKASIDDLQALHNSLAADVAGLKAEINALKGDIQKVADDIKAVDAKYEVITAMLSNALRSLVFIPNLYVDGIETVEYEYVASNILSNVKSTEEALRDGYKFTEFDDYNVVDGEFVYGPAWGVDYHMNPSTSDAVYADVKGWLCREVEVATRATGLELSSPEQCFANKNGVLTVGLQIANPEKLQANGPVKVEEGQTGNISYGKDNIIAIQVASDANGQDTLITSDYAMLFPETVTPEAIVWTKNNARGNVGTVDEACTVEATNIVHLFDTPKEALECEDPSFWLGWNDTEGIKLSDYIGMHYVKECAISGHDKFGTWNFGSEKQYGLKYIFETVDYQATYNDNVRTRDSRYCVLDKTTGLIVARNVTVDGNTSDKQDIASVGREPLVRVRVVDAATEKITILDGYIRVKIDKETAGKPEEKKPYVIDEYATQLDWNITFNGCNEFNSEKTTWSQFNEWVLTQLELDKNVFDAQYSIDGTEITGAQQGLYACNVYSDTNGTASNYGTITYNYENGDLNNCGFEVSLTPAEIEALTHDKDELPVTVTLYARYTGTTTSKYSHIYVKFDVVIDRTMVQTSIEKKINEYWFGLDGNDNGWDAIALNIAYPLNGSYATAWDGGVHKALVENKAVFTTPVAAHKYFFVPVNTTITDQHGDIWTITAKSADADTDWNALKCLYVSDSHVWPYTAEGMTDNAKLGEILKNCAIDYNAGVYNNTSLYAVKDGEYTEIAKMNPANGEIQLVHAEAYPSTHKSSLPLDLILNAIGYTKDHANISTEFHTWAGIVASNGCGVVVDAYNTPGENNINYPIWEASWQRPINLVTTCDEAVYDAENNGEWVSIVDKLSFYDWRGEEEGDMQGLNHWLWAYYQVDSIEVDLMNATTNLNGGNLEKTKLSEVSDEVELWGSPVYGDLTKAGHLQNFTINLTGMHTFNSADQVPALAMWFVANQKQLGGIYYANNGDNVTDFVVRIPLSVNYLWGHFDTHIDITIKRTLGN